MFQMNFKKNQLEMMASKSNCEKHRSGKRHFTLTRMRMQIWHMLCVSKAWHLEATPE
jgi:hypothetical protein